MKYGISGYHRPECETYHTLKKMGANDSDIVICVNDESDYENYKYPNLIYIKGDCVATNRNHILEVIGEPVVLLDDDIKSFKKLERKDTKSGVGFVKIQDIKTFETIIGECFAEMERRKAETFGAYSIENAEWAQEAVIRDGTYSANKLYQGGCCGFKGGKKMYDESFKVLDDYDLILRCIRQGKRTLRRNDLIASKGKMGENKGGYYTLYRMGIQRHYGEMLALKYFDLVRSNDNFSRFSLRRKNGN